MATGDIVQRLEVLCGTRDPEDVTPSNGAICQALDEMIELVGTIEDGADGITPTVTITSISGGHNIAFSYGDGDSRNTSFDVMDGAPGQDGADGSDGSDGAPGADGITPSITVSSITGGHTISIYYAENDPRNTSVNVMNGTNGTNGQNGYTPVRGTDYWTANDVLSMEAYCANYIDTQLGTVLAASYPSS